jgi:hypothetical protein
MTLDKSGYDEAIERVSTAIELLRQLSETPERDAREVRMRSFLGQIVAAARGFSAPELAGQTARLNELLRRVTNPRARYLGLFSQWNVAFSRGELKRADELASELLTLANADATEYSQPSA